MNKSYTIKITLAVRSPFITSTGTETARGIDRVFARDFSENVIVYGSHIKGKLREALIELQSTGLLAGMDLNHFFGRENQGSNYLPERARLKFGDFRLVENLDKRDLAIRTSINSLTGTALESNLQTLELMAKSGLKTHWKGEINFPAKDVQEATQVAVMLKQGFQWITNLGAVKGSGYGSLENVVVSGPKEQKPGIVSTTMTSDTVTLVIALEDDLFVGGIARGTNYKESEHIITGAVLKGSFSRHINAYCGEKQLTTPISPANKVVDQNFPALCKWFSQITFNHAFPSTNTANPVQRPVTIPFSTVMSGDRENDYVHDLALSPDVLLMPDQKAPIYKIDWKDKDSPPLLKKFGWQRCQQVNKTRTAIHKETRTAAENKLYTFQYISPYSDKGNEKVKWVATIRLPIDRISSEAEIKQLQNELILALNSGWRYIGKRDARFIVKAQDQPPVMAKNMHTNGECVEHKAIVLLQTDALLFDGKKRAGQLDIDLFDVYAKYWADITEKSCKLSDFFARQKMVGGYLSRRYAAGDTYYPYILTEAGSVFVLEIEEAYKAKTILTEIRKYGLPLPDEILGTLKDKNASWAQCPFVPENGFGEIQINLNWHWQKKMPQPKNTGGN